MPEKENSRFRIGWLVVLLMYVAILAFFVHRNREETAAVSQISVLKLEELRSMEQVSERLGQLGLHVLVRAARLLPLGFFLALSFPRRRRWFSRLFVTLLPASAFAILLSTGLLGFEFGSGPGLRDLALPSIACVLGARLGTSASRGFGAFLLFFPKLAFLGLVVAGLGLAVAYLTTSTEPLELRASEVSSEKKRELVRLFRESKPTKLNEGETRKLTLTNEDLDVLVAWSLPHRVRRHIGSSPESAYRYPRISPDGGRVALSVRDQEDDLWIWDFARETLSRLTFVPGRETTPVWTPDGKQVAFASERDGQTNLCWKAHDGTGSVERLNESENLQFPNAFTPDGRQLVFTDFDGTTVNLGVVSLDGSPERLLATEFNERNGEISPDGQWLAYESNASGQYEIYVRPFPNVEDGQWLISRGGGTRPLWAPDGRELFYVAPGPRLMAVGVQAEPGFEAGNPEVVYEGRFYVPRGGAPFRTYDIDPDGERFLMIELGGSDETLSTEFILVLNWFEELNRLVPTDN